MSVLERCLYERNVCIREMSVLEKSLYSWVSRDVIISLQLQIDAQSSEGNSFSLYVLILCLAAKMCNFVRFFHSRTA